jgi:hypothetical protein
MLNGKVSISSLSSVHSPHKLLHSDGLQPVPAWARCLGNICAAVPAPERQQSPPVQTCITGGGSGNPAAAVPAVAAAATDIRMQHIPAEGKQSSVAQQGQHRW